MWNVRDTHVRMGRVCVLCMHVCTVCMHVYACCVCVPLSETLTPWRELYHLPFFLGASGKGPAWASEV